MRSDVHLAALKAAAKVAFGVLVLNGCSAATEEPTPDDTATDESAAYTKKKKACHEEADAAVEDAKPSCDAVLASTFPDAGAFVFHNPGDPTPPVSADVKACCTDELTGTDGGFGWQSKYRWACCDALGNGGGTGERDQKIAIACTPWGPPVPPSMARRRAFVEGVA